MAQILGSRDLLRAALCLRPKVQGEIEDRDDSFSEAEIANPLSITLLLEAATIPVEGMAVKNDAIYAFQAGKVTRKKIYSVKLHIN